MEGNVCGNFWVTLSHVDPESNAITSKDVCFPHATYGQQMAFFSSSSVRVSYLKAEVATAGGGAPKFNIDCFFWCSNDTPTEMLTGERRNLTDDATEEALTSLVGENRLIGKHG